MLNICAHLPPDSHYKAAIADDDEVAKQMDLDAPPRPPSLTEFGPVVRAITDLDDRVQALTRAVVASTGQKPPAFKPRERPKIAAERERQRRRMTKHRSLVRRVLPHKAEQG